MKVLFRPRYYVRFLSFLLCLGLLFVFPLNVSAADDSNAINPLDLNYQALVSTSSGVVDVTDDITVTPITGTTSSFHTFIRYLFPYDTSSAVRLYASFMLFDDYSLNSNHEYNLNFKWGYNANLSCSIQVVIVYNDVNGNVLKEQILFEQAGTGKNIIHSIDTDFKPDLSNISGSYNSVLQIRFLQDGLDSATLGQGFYISPEINFTDKDDNSNWFQKIINAIKEIPDKISNLRDNISNYFSNLGDRLSAKFENVGSSITNKFEEVKNAIGNWFSEIGEKLSQKFGEVGEAITSKFAEIGAEFSATFDTFKPRFYEQLNWTYGFYDGYDYEFIPEQEDFGFAVISEPFVVPQGTTYLLSFAESDLFPLDQMGNYFFQLFEVGNDSTIFDGSLDSYLNDFECVLEPGNAYVFVLYNLYYESYESVFPGISLNDICNSVVKVYADEGWLTAFGRMILNGVKNFFVPSDDYLDTVYNRITEFYEGKFGVFAQSTTLFIDILREINDLFDTDTYKFVFPEISVPIGNETITIVESQKVDMNQWLLSDSFGSKLYKIYELSVWAIFIVLILKYALRVESVVFGSMKGFEF